MLRKMRRRNIITLNDDARKNVNILKQLKSSYELVHMQYLIKKSKDLITDRYIKTDTFLVIGLCIKAQQRKIIIDLIAEDSFRYLYRFYNFSILSQKK